MPTWRRIAFHASRLLTIGLTLAFVRQPDADLIYGVGLVAVVVVMLCADLDAYWTNRDPESF